MCPRTNHSGETGLLGTMCSLPPNTPFGSAHTELWGGGGLSATSLQPLSDLTAAVDAHACVEQPKRRGRS
ncbi:hypothetical protein HaLaN_25115, partial [Haematococcus lacustris]